MSGRQGGQLRHSRGRHRIGSYAFDSCGGLTSVALPAGVASIGSYAFNACVGLTGITLPASVVNIGNSAFTGCTSLTSASFLGNAPTMNSTVFATCAGGFTVYFLDGKTGFTTPTWNGYTAVNLGTTAAPAIWLLAHGQPYNADLRNDPNNDGVSLLVAYALNLDPNLNLSDRLPKPVLANNQLRLTYYAGMAGITYTVESSADMQTWSPGGVIVSDPDSNGFRAASVASGPARRFLRWSCAHPDARL